MGPEARAEWEQRLARELGKVNASVRREVLEALGDPPQYDALTADMWENIRLRYNGAMSPTLEDVFEAAIAYEEAALGVGVDWSQVHERAAEWARQYVPQLTGNINRTSMRQVQRATVDFYEQGISLRDMRNRLAKTFGPVRADAIAITEVTRADSAGSQQYRWELEALGLRTRQIIQTAEDEKVCPVCGPKSDKDVEEVGHPPFHVRCRCWERTLVIEEESTN